MFMTASFAPCPGVRMLGDIVGVLVWEKFCSGPERGGGKHKVAQSIWNKELRNPSLVCFPNASCFLRTSKVPSILRCQDPTSRDQWPRPVKPLKPLAGSWAPKLNISFLQS